MAVVNSMGRIRTIEPCQKAIDSADYRSFRNQVKHSDERLVPDSAVVTRLLFGSYIENVNHFSDDLKDIISRGSYIAVQHKASNLDPDKLAPVLDKIANETNSSIVFFAAGTVTYHDSFTWYQKVVDKLQDPTRAFIMDERDPNVWSVCATIAHAKAVLATSLHVRILAFQFQKPRVTWCDVGHKHYHFIKHWEQLPDDNICFKYDETAEALRHSVPMEETRIKELENAYLASFDEWSSMLLHGERKNVTMFENGTIVEVR
ncbi:MAG: hypothetical protein SGILL_010551 [Bacillariaceae sp.]